MEELKEIFKDCFWAGEILGQADGYGEKFEEYYEANKDKIELAIYRLQEQKKQPQ